MTGILNERAELLQGAEKAVNGARNAQYGDPHGDFRRSAQMQSAYIAGVFERKALDLPKHVDVDDVLVSLDDVQDLMYSILDMWDIAAMMNLLKQSRIAWTPGKMDSWMDTAGYAACGWDCASTIEDAVRV